MHKYSEIHSYRIQRYDKLLCCTWVVSPRIIMCYLLFPFLEVFSKLILPKWDIFMLISWIFVSKLHVYYVYFIDNFKIINVGGCACYKELLIVYIFLKPTKKLQDLNLYKSYGFCWQKICILDTIIMHMYNTFS